MANEAMSEERINEIQEKLSCGQEIWYSETIRELLAALREAQSRLTDAEYWCQQIRRHDGEYEEPRDAYRTFCKVSDLYQQAQERVQRAEEAGYRRGIEAAFVIEKAIRALLPPDAPTEEPQP